MQCLNQRRSLKEVQVKTTTKAFTYLWKSAVEGKILICLGREFHNFSAIMTKKALITETEMKNKR